MKIDQGLSSNDADKDALGHSKQNYNHLLAAAEQTSDTESRGETDSKQWNTHMHKNLNLRQIQSRQEMHTPTGKLEVIKSASEMPRQDLSPHSPPRSLSPSVSPD